MNKRLCGFLCSGYGIVRGSNYICLDKQVLSQLIQQRPVIVSDKTFRKLAAVEIGHSSLICASVNNNKNFTLIEET